MHISQFNYIAGGEAAPPRAGAAQCSRGGVMHVLVGETPRYKQIDRTISGLIALQADELHYKPKVRSIRRILSTLDTVVRAVKWAYNPNHSPNLDASPNH